MQKLGQNVNQEELDDMMAEIDVDGERMLMQITYSNTLIL